MADHEYELYALASTHQARPRWLGDFATYDDALLARDEDVLAGLRAGGGWYSLFEHLIVGPGLAGPRTPHRHTTTLGVDPCEDRVPSHEDLDDAQAWLGRIRRR